MNIDLVLWILLLLPLFLVFVLAILAFLPCLGCYNLQKYIFKIFNAENPCKQVKMKEVHSKKSKVDTEGIFTIEGISNEVKHATFKYNRTTYFTIMLFYSSVFTAAFWPILFSSSMNALISLEALI